MGGDQVSTVVPYPDVKVGYDLITDRDCLFFKTVPPPSPFLNIQGNTRKIDAPWLGQGEGRAWRSKHLDAHALPARIISRKVVISSK